MLRFSTVYSILNEDTTYDHRTILDCAKPEHYHVEIPKDVTLTVIHPIDIKIALRPGGTVKLPQNSNSCSFQNQSAIDSFRDSYDRSKQILVLNEDSITSLLLPISTKVSFTQKDISYHFENTTSKPLSITDLNSFINTYELARTLSFLAIDKTITITPNDKACLISHERTDKELIALFAKQNNGGLDYQKIDLFIQEDWSKLFLSDHVDAPLLGTVE
ncbi:MULTISPECIES: hypothetical protein [unclassified Candidatus Tisiphia]|uniref:hypothetical protein n=1 Tax=unclassified Candidatus Tisiphia TaxID=2996318 RepID=UPI00312C71D5